MKESIKIIFDNVKYWKDKTLLLRAINQSAYNNKNLILLLLNIPPNILSKEYEAKRELWNHTIISEKLGDDILNNVSSEILNDIDFAKKAILKYNRTYIYLSKNLQDRHEIASMCVSNEISSNNEYHAPILMYMPKKFQNNLDIALIASSRNIHNIQYSSILCSNKYFIIDIMNSLSSNEDKRKVLSYIDKSFLDDKIFVSKLGCFDNLCDRFQGDILYVSNAVIYDISILNKTELFHESILHSVINSQYYKDNLDYSLAIIFSYIKRFNDNYKELDDKIENKTILNKILWDMGEVLSNEFINI